MNYFSWTTYMVAGWRRSGKRAVDNPLAWMRDVTDACYAQAMGLWQPDHGFVRLVFDLDGEAE